MALSPEFGGTTIDAKLLLDALKGRESFVLSISDGEIQNWDSAKGKFMELAKRNYYAHIQVGSSNSFTSDLEASGLPVSYVNSGEDLSKLMVKAAMDAYRGFTQK